MIKALFLFFGLLALFNGGIATAVAGANYVFYPLPHQEQGSLVAAEKIISNVNSGLWFVDVHGELIFYDGQRLNNAVDGAGDKISGVTDAVMVGQTVWLVKDGQAFAYSPATTQLIPLNISQEPFQFVVQLGQEAWFANRHGLYAVQDYKLQPEFFAFPEPFTLTGLFTAGESIFIAGELGAYEFRGRQLLEPRVYPEQRVTAVFEDSNQQLWFGTLNGLYLSRDVRPFHSLHSAQISHQFVSSITETDMGLWVGTKQGLNLIDLQSFELKHFRALRNDVFSIDGDRIKGLLRDEEGALWIATNNGVNYFPTTTALFKRLRYGLDQGTIQASQINDVIQLNGGSIWLATDKGTIELAENLDIVSHTPSLGVVNHLAYRDGLLWLATESGLKVYSRLHNDWSPVAIPALFQDKPIISLMVDRYNSVWIGMPSRLYRYWPDSEELISFGSHWLQDPSGEEAVTALYEDSENNVWVGTDYALYQYEAGLLHMVEQTANQGGVLDLYEDRMTQLWIVNNHSLQLAPNLDPLQLRFIKLMGDHATPYCVAGDSSGVWVGSSKGLSYYNFPAELKQHFSPPVGVVEKEFYSQACETLNSGTLLFGGREGILEVTPSKLLNSDMHFSTIVISEVRVDHQLRQLAGASEQLLTIPFGASISFGVGVLPFTGQRKMQYRLLGADESEWRRLNGTQLFIDTLGPGDYKLELRLDLLNSARSQQTTAYPFRVLRPWYLSYWLLSAIVIAVAVLIFVIVTWRARGENQQNLHLKQAVFRKTAKIELQKKQLYASNKQMQRILQVRQNFMAQLSHELRTPLVLILGPVKKMLETSQREEKEQLDLVVRNVERSLHLAEQLLNRDALAFVEPDKLCEQLVSPIIQASCQSWQMEAERKEIILCLEDDTCGLSVKMAPYHLEIMIGNLLSNALKYTARSGCITVGVKHRGQKLVISVSDTGKGMSEDIRKNIFDGYFKEDANFNLEMGFGLGLSTVKELVERYDGDISVISYQGVGSEFILTLPLYREVEATTKHSEKTGEPRSSLPSVIVASTDSEFVSCLKLLLQQEFSIAVAKDGYEAVLLAKQNRPDLMLCDIDLPGLQGRQVRERLHDDPSLRWMRFVLMVEDNFDIDALVSEAEIDLILSKPIAPDTLLARLSFLLNGEQPPFSSFEANGETVLSTSEPLSLWRKNVMVLVEDHFHHADFGTAAAAKALYMSERSLQRKFKQEFGMLFKDYVVQFRFEQAKLMLKQGDRISDVALSCGFNEPSYFSTRFKAHFGITPSQYAAKYQAQPSL
ncbi:helix-turn-helix domain-containing protein [Photobacterium sp. SDRW27]|uniref:hybrid sensor histidine kinase/response regulator transcription factor n=1 Tax=Photobacterium obscurum TaxID=2829490 RepID=UPI0022440E4E|nr:ATP-binding protein [Photobacterium obscurum]MCW8327551.1 helix-turn-helix domain-containing protein [Photobacterium obscurum]